jgi:hypothetical protein
VLDGSRILRGRLAWQSAIPRKSLPQCQPKNEPTYGLTALLPQLGALLVTLVTALLDYLWYDKPLPSSTAPVRIFINALVLSPFLPRFTPSLLFSGPAMNSG